MRGVLRTAAERARLIAHFDASGLSASAFAEREGVASSTFYQWLAHRSKTPFKKPPPRFIEVEPVKTDATGARVQLGEAILTFERTPAPEYLAALVRALTC
jgi:transposase-like protein